MLLAALMEKHPDELRADLQRHYGVDIDHAMAGEHSAGHVAALTANLPPDARVRVAENADAGWTRREILLADIRNALAMYIYMQADPRTRGAKPEMVGPSWMSRSGKRSLEARAMTPEQLLEELGKPRRG